MFHNKIPQQNSTTKLLVISLLLVVSCEQIDDHAPNNTDLVMQKSITIEDDYEGYRQIVLGNARVNAYEIGYMRETIDFLNDEVTNSPTSDLTIEPTHYYIKIAPAGELDLQFLDELDKSDDIDAPVLHEYPLDLEIQEEGDYYRDITDEEDRWNYPVYTVIPVDYQFASSLDYDILAELYEPTDEQYFLEIVSMFRAGWYDDLSAEFDEEITTTDLDDLIYFLNHPEEVDEVEEEEVQQKFFRRLRRWVRRAFTRPAGYTPQGTINIENTNNNPATLQPFMNAKISIGRNFFWKYTYTNAEGQFVAPKSYRGKVRIRSKFRSNAATIRKAFNEVLGIGISDHLMTMTRSGNNRTKNVFYDSRRHFWVKATAHNGIALYNNFCLENGISETVRDANVWAFSNGNNASAPMLYTYPQLATISMFANIGQADVWNNLASFGVGGAIIVIVPVWLRPDLIFRGLEDKPVAAGNDRSSTIRIHQVVFHESGHFSHAKKVNALYWARNFAATVSNSVTTTISQGDSDPYRDGSQPSFQAADRMSIVEGWGNFTEYKVTSAVYGGAYFGLDFIIDLGFNSVDNRMENFDMFQRPMSAVRTDEEGWFLHGLMWDLLDNRNEIPTGFEEEVFSEYWNGDRSGNPINFITDNCTLTVNGTIDVFNLAPVFNSLNANVENGCGFYWSLRAQNPNAVPALNELFNSYGINCL